MRKLNDMRNTAIQLLACMATLLPMLLFSPRLAAQHPVIRLEGYMMNLISEGQPRGRMGRPYIERYEVEHRFFLTSLDIPWEEMGAFSCFYKLDLKEINHLYQTDHYDGAHADRIGVGYYHLDTVGIASLRKPLPSDPQPKPNIQNLDHRAYLDQSPRARVDFYKCSFWVVYLEDHGYGDCDGELRLIPQYGYLDHPDNRWHYLCSMVMPVFLKLPQLYRPWEH
jgi:hypothetical protein